MGTLRALLATAGIALALAACTTGAEEQPTLLMGGIPDQDRVFLEERFGGMADYLSEEIGIPVAYQPSTDYTALVTAFRNGDVLLGWFGGLTGVQARLETEGAEAVAQRPIDADFHSVFVASAGLGADTLEDLRGRSFTFGSESSTSGHLMPRFFLDEAGIDPDTDFDTVGYSGSHDQTWRLVEAGSYEAGALSASVWDRAVEEEAVDLDRVALVERVGPYVDYHWVAHPDIDEVYGDGTTDAIVEALLSMHEGGPEAQRLLEMFSDERFISTENHSYEAIERVARDLGLIR